MVTVMLKPALVVWCALALLGSPAASSGTTGTSGDSIAYLHVSRASIGVYVMRPDGSSQNLIANDADWFAWSPSGSRLLVHRHNGGRHSIYVVNRDGSGLRRVTDRAIEPTWSPDETRIAFAKVGGSGIHTMRMDGTARKALTKPPKYGNDDLAAWSPDGSRIAFERWTGNDFQLALVSPTGRDLRIIVSCFNDCGAPVWSPDGRRLAFSDNADIWVVNPDGTEIANLTNTPRQQDENPTWSPNGRFLAFESRNRSTDRNPEIHTIRVDGQRHRNVTHEPRFDAYPDWSPDGRSVVFSSIRDGNIDVWVMTPTGSNALNLTEHDQGLQNWWPRWSP